MVESRKSPNKTNPSLYWISKKKHRFNLTYCKQSDGDLKTLLSPKVHCWYFPDLFFVGANKYVEETLLLKPVLASLLEKSGVSADVLVAIKPQRARVVYMVVTGVESSNGTYEPFPFEKGWTPSNLFNP